MERKREYKTPDVMLESMSAREDILLSSSESGALALIDCGEENWM